MIVLEYLLCTAACYLARPYLPQGPATPYIDVLLPYHLFLLCILARGGVTSKQKIGLSMSLPMIFLGHIVFAGVLVGIVFEREYLPLFALLQYLLPALAPFEVSWFFQEPERGRELKDPKQLPSNTNEEYVEFLHYMEQGTRRFQKPGRSIKAEYAAWLKHQGRKRPVAN